MHIVHLNYGYTRGQSPDDLVAAHWTLHRLGASQAGHPGIDVTVLQRFSVDTRLEVDGVRYQFFKDISGASIARPWSYPRRLHGEAARIAPDVLHVHGLPFPVQTLLLRHATQGRVPIVVQHHGGMPARGGNGYLQRLLARSADGFIFTGAGNAEPWIRAGIVPNGSHVFELLEASSDFRPVDYRAARRALDLGDAPMVLWVARLIAGKDPLTALAGFERAAQTCSAARLVMVFQDGTLRTQMDAWISARPALSPRIALLGPLPHEDLALWFSSADAFITASRQEGSNYALIESQACGAPAVCSDIAPHRYIAGAADTSRFFHPGDVTGCGEALGAVLRGRSDFVRNEVRRHFERRLTWAGVAADSLEVYAEVIRRRAPVAAAASRA